MERVTLSTHFVTSYCNFREGDGDDAHSVLEFLAPNPTPRPPQAQQNETKPRFDGLAGQLARLQIFDDSGEEFLTLPSTLPQEEEEEDEDDDDYEEKTSEDDDDDDEEVDFSDSEASPLKKRKRRAAKGARRAASRVLREIGFAMNACTSFLERQNKAIKEADRLCRRDDRYGRHARDVLLIASRAELQPSSEGGDVSGGGGAARQDRRDSIGVGWLDAGVDAGDDTWRESVRSIEEDPATFASRVRQTIGATAASRVRICRGALLRFVSGSVVLSVAHSCRLTNGRFGLVSALVCLSGGEVRVLVKYYAAATGSTPDGRHAEIALRHLTLGDYLHAHALANVERREHILRIASSCADEEQYLLDTGLFHYSEKVRRDKDVYR